MPPPIPHRRRFALALSWGLVLALVACGGEEMTAPTTPPSPASGPVAPSPNPTPGPTRSPGSSPSSATEPSPGSLQVPSDAPTEYESDAAPEDLPPKALAPPGATVTQHWYLSPPTDPIAQFGLVWTRGDDPLALEQGYVAWQRSDAAGPWRAVYGFTDSPDAAVLGITFAVADLTGDGIADTLTREATGGSGDCARWRVIATESGGAAEIYGDEACDTMIQPSDGDLQIRQALFAPTDAHCCPSRFRVTTLSWNGESWDVVGRRVESA